MDVHHDTQRHQFRIDAHPEPAVLDYRPIDGVWDITHTYVPPSGRGQGLAGRLTAAALAAAREAGVKVRPSCSYVAAYLQRHPEDQDLLD